jgi:single-strand DNA-binding protein
MTDEDERANVVLLRGRISGEPEERELPSGDVMVTFRLVVRREPSPMTKGSRQVSDWVACTAWGGRARASARAWHLGDEVEVRGALRRRYYRGGTGTPGTSLEVEMLTGRRLQRAPASDGPDLARAQGD